MDREPQPDKQPVGDRLLKTLGIDPEKWTVGDRRIALLGIGIVLTIVGVAICGYLFGWTWTGLTEPKQRTFWDWLNLLIVPIVLALGGYLFTRSENRRGTEDAERQRTADRQIADRRTQDEALQAYLDQMSTLLLEKKLRSAEEASEVRTLARARTLTVLRRLDVERKGSVLQFLYESGLLDKDRLVVNLSGAYLRGADLRGAHLFGADLREAYLREAYLREAYLRGAHLYGANLYGAHLFGAYLRETNLREANLRGAHLYGANLSEANLSRANLSEANLSRANLYRDNLYRANLSGANLSGADLRRAYLAKANLRGANLREAALSHARGVTNEELDQQAESLEGATMPNGQKYEDWLKSKGRSEDGENSGPS